MIDVATELKKRKARRIFVVATFGLFTDGLAKFDKAVADGIIYKVVTTNLTYQTPELLSKPYYINCDMSKYIAYIIDTLNHDLSISDLLDPYERIESLVNRYIGRKKQFEIMQKVGMSKKEVRASIRSQILKVFFLPLVMACIHLIVAFPMMNRLILLLEYHKAILTLYTDIQPGASNVFVPQRLLFLQQLLDAGSASNFLFFSPGYVHSQLIHHLAGIFSID